MAGAEDDREAFELRPLLYPALPNDPDIVATSPAALARSLRCAEPYGAYVYLGSTDGKVFCYVQPSALDGEEDDRVAGPSQDFRHIDTRIISSKVIERIIVLPALAVAAVLSEATLTFYELPSFLPIPQQVLPHVKGVMAVALDDKESSAGSNGGGVDAENLTGLCIIRRKGIMLVKMSKDTWRVVKEIPLSGGATNARRFGDWLCISTFSEYNVVNLKDATLSVVGLPISQTTESPSASSRPSIVTIHEGDRAESCEFLITSHSEDLTLGVFIGQEGEPTAKLLEWPSHPRAISLHHPYVHSLLRNDTIQIHDVTSMQLVQTVHLPSLLEPRTLSTCTSTLTLVEEKENWGMSLVTISLDAAGIRRRADTVKHGWRHIALKRRRIHSDVLMIGKNVVQGVVRTNLLNSAIRAAHRGDLKRAESLAEVVWQQRSTFAADTLQALELEYVNQLIAVESARLLDFKTALKFSLRGSLDFRLWLSLFPSLISGLAIDDKDAIEISSKVADILDDLGNLESFPTNNLIRNYCPPLDITTNTTLSKLKDSLASKIDQFIRELVTSNLGNEEVMSKRSKRRLLETVQARLLVRNGDKDAVSAFLDEAQLCDIQLLEPELTQMGCYAVLVQLYREQEDWAKSLDLQTRLIDHELEDKWFKGTTQGVAETLDLCNDAEIVHRYSVWLVQRDSAAGVKALLKGRTTTTNVSGLTEERATLKELQGVDEKAALAYLEAIALTRKQQDAEAHRELADVLLGRIRSALLRDRAPSERITEEYTQGAYAESYVAHLTLQIEDLSIAAIDRLKLMVLLQSSTVLNIHSLLSQIEEEPLLGYERAILNGRLGNDEIALQILAVQLRDANSAETYCSQERRPLSLPVLQSVESVELKIYCTLLSRSLKRSVAINERRKESQLHLLSTLLRVYMQASQKDDFHVATTHLLNTQAMHLNTREILATVPAHWSVRTLETFLSRSIRRETHHANEGQIQRATALAQNLETAEMLWSKRRGLGGVIEDGTEEQPEGVEREEGTDDLGRALLEKIKFTEKGDRGDALGADDASDVVEVKQG